MLSKSHTIGYGVPEARRRLGDISPPTFYQLVRDGKLKVTKLGRRTVVTDKQISDCLAACEVASLGRDITIRVGGRARSGIGANDTTIHSRAREDQRLAALAAAVTQS